MSELADSQLGTKEYWDQIYVKELENFKDNDQDVGEIWFGERTEQKLVNWLVENVEKDKPIVDIGTGNGHLLTLLAEEGFINLTGIDYAASSVSLARAVNSEFPHIQFLCQNVLEATGEAVQRHHVCVDKGTYDAISLSSSSATDRIAYKNQIHSRVNPEGGYFLLASVNWTVEELTNFYSDLFTVHQVLPCKQFTFGGVTGMDVSIVAFKPTVRQLAGS